MSKVRDDIKNTSERQFCFAGYDTDNGNSMKLRVECYAGAKADERPVRFRLGEQEHTVKEVLDQWYGPTDDFFKLRTDDGNLYILRRNRSADEWHLESFRANE